MCTLLVVLGGRLVQLQALDGPKLAAAAQEHRLDTADIVQTRGRILDRNGRPLAYSVAARTVYADPTLVTDVPGTAARLAPLISRTVSDLIGKMRSPGRYVPLARNVTPTVANQVLALELPGIAAEDTSQRLYPAGDAGAAVIGFTNSAGVGVGGIERQFDQALAGTPGRLVVETGKDGQQIPSGVRQQTDAVPGSSVRLTLDEDLQYMVQRALGDAVRQTGAKDGQIVVLDAHTAQVLAMASAPTFDAQSPGASSPDLLGNPAVSAPFEPGSANKVVTFSAALERGIIRPDTPMSVPGSIQIADRVVHDAWWHRITHYTAAGVLAQSSNVGTLMIAQRLGPQAFYDNLTKLGIGSRTGIELPAESRGLLLPPSQWSGSTFANLPIGQGVSMTALQLASMYQTIANDGVRVAPRIVRDLIGPDGLARPQPAPPRTQVMSATTARTLRTMLEMVTHRGGTAPGAAIDGYRVAGKTGTAQQVDPTCRCYAGSNYWATFAGIAPADAPSFVVAIVIDGARGGPHGGAVAAPLFHSIASYALAERGIVPSGTPPPAYRLVLD